MFQEQAPKDRAALAIDYAIDIFRPKTALERDNGLGAIRNAIAIAFECQQEGGIPPAWIDKVLGRARYSQSQLCQTLPIKKFTRIFLARRGNIAVSDDIAWRN